MNQVIPPIQGPQPSSTSQVYQPNQPVVMNGVSYQVKQQQPGQGMTIVDPKTQQEMAVAEQDMPNVKPEIKPLQPTTTMATDMANAVLSKLLNEKLEPISMVKVIAPTSTENKVMAAAKKWSNFRKEMELRSKAKREAILNQQVTSHDSREIQFLRANAATAPKPDLDGRDEHSGVPVRSKVQDVEVGLTEFPYGTDKAKNPEGYGKMTMEEMDQKFLAEHPHFDNEKKLQEQTMTRDESSEYVEGEEKKRKREKEEAESPHPRYSPKEETPVSWAESALDKAIGITHTSAEEDVKKKDEVEQERTKLPVQFKDIKKAPGANVGFTEPNVIPEAQGSVKEAINGLRDTQKKIEKLKTDIATVSKPLQEALMNATKPLNEEMNKAAADLSFYIQVLHSTLSETESKIANIEDEIYTAVDREQAVAPPASLAQILKKATDTQPELVVAINKIKAIVEAENTKLVLEQSVYKYPVSEQQKKKISSEDGSEQLIHEIVEAVKALQAVNGKL